MKLFNVSFDYVEQAHIGNIIAETADQAVEGAKHLAVKGGVKDPSNFVAAEITDFEKNEHITVQ